MGVEESRIGKVEAEKETAESEMCSQVVGDEMLDHMGICPPVELSSGDVVEEAAIEDVGGKTHNFGANANGGDLFTQGEKSKRYSSSLHCSQC